MTATTSVAATGTAVTAVVTVVKENSTTSAAIVLVLIRTRPRRCLATAPPAVEPRTTSETDSVRAGVVVVV